MMVLICRQSSPYILDLNFQFSFKSKLGRPVPDNKMIHLLNLNELPEEHILPLYHAGISSGSAKLAPSSIRRDI